MEDIYRRELPLIEGAREAVERIGERWPLGLASSSNREIIDLFLELSGLAEQFRVTVSSEEVERGKPAPDVYLEALQAAGGGPGGVHGGGGLGERHPLRPGGRDARGGPAEPGLSAR